MKDSIFIEYGQNVCSARFQGWNCSCDRGIPIGHDHLELVAVFRPRQRTENSHGDGRNWTAGWKGFYMWPSHLICSFACALAAIVHSCTNIVGHLNPIYLTCHGVVHAAPAGGLASCTW